MFTRTRAVVALVIIMAAVLLPHSALAAGIDPGSTTSPAVCSWTVVGHSSNCDRLDPNTLFQNSAWPTACKATNDMIGRTVESATLADGIYVKVTYSGGTKAGCRSVAASLYVPNYSGSKPCAVTLTRTSDGSTSVASLVRRGGFWSAETLAFYDNSVESYASVSCTYGGHTYTGKTGLW